MDKTNRSGEAVRVVDEEAIARARLRIATRQWLLAKAMPQSFGDRLEHSGRLEIETPPQPRHPGEDRMAEIAARFLGGMLTHASKDRVPELAEDAARTVNGATPQVAERYLRGLEAAGQTGKAVAADIKAGRIGKAPPKQKGP
jgi:hypothetical protein